MNSASNRTQVFYIPVGLTQVQKDLLEILISIHAESFVSCVDKRLLPELHSKLEENGTNLKRDLSMTALTDVQLTEWFFENIRAVSNHPCLLVEHYMPRQFLLMEPTERLIYTSDKFGKLNLMVDLLLNRKDKSRPLQVAIISHSVKELDLIEGVMLGKVAKLKRLSGTSLFDEKHEYDDQTSGSSTTNGENASSSGSVAPEQIGKSKDEYNYSKSRRKNNTSQLDWLFLATTTHLTHSEDLLSRYNLDLIISFDPMLDESLPSIFKVRKNGRKTPLLKLLVQDSPDHYLLSKKKLTTTSEKLIFDSIVHFLKYRADIKDLISLQQYENIIHSLIKETDPGEFLPSVNPGSSRNNADLIPFLTNPMELMPLTYGKYELRLQSGPMDIKNYQYILKTLTAERLKQCHVEYEEREKLVLKTRLKETKRLNDFDDLKVSIGQHFKKLKENETKINDSEKRVERTRSELEVLEERLRSLVERKSELVRLLKLEDLEKEIENQKQHTRLSDEVSSFKKSNDEESLKNDDLRSKYQQKSSEAASEVLKTSAFKAEKEELERQLNGPFTKWELIILQEKEAQLKSSLRKMVQQSQFLIQYMNRIQGQYNIGNEPAKKSSPAANNSSRYTTRTTRATSPTYT